MDTPAAAGSASTRLAKAWRRAAARRLRKARRAAFLRWLALPQPEQQAELRDLEQRLWNRRIDEWVADEFAALTDLDSDESDPTP